MKTSKEFYVVMDKDGRLWAGYNQFTTRPWQAKFYFVREHAEKTAVRNADMGARVVKAKISFELEEANER